MPFDFPNPPLTVGQTVVASNGVTYKWDGTSWLPQAPAAGGGASITVSDTAPASPTPAEMWFDSTVLNTFLYYNDGNSSQWVTLTPDGAGIADAPSDGYAYSRVNATWASGGMVSGAIQLPGNAVSALQAVPLQQVQSTVAPAWDNVGRNLLHNSLFNVQQRGQGSWTANGNLTADRWGLQVSVDAASVSLVTLADADRTAIGDEAALYALQNVFTGSSTSGAFNFLVQKIERLRRLSGKTVTISFWARASSGTPKIGVGWYQWTGSGGSPSAGVGGNCGVTPALSSTWTRYSLTTTLPSASGKTLGTNGDDWTELDLWYSDQGANASRSGGIGVQSGTINLWGIQCEIGTVATPLEKLDPRLDLANCQRFYCVMDFLGGGYFGAATASGFYANTPFPVTMRGGPTVTYSSASYGAPANALSSSGIYPTSVCVTIGSSASGTGWAYAKINASADL